MAGVASSVIKFPCSLIIDFIVIGEFRAIKHFYMPVEFPDAGEERNTR